MSTPSTCYVVQTKDKWNPESTWHDYGTFPCEASAVSAASQEWECHRGIAVRLLKRVTVDELWNYWEAKP